MSDSKERQTNLKNYLKRSSEIFGVVMEICA